MPYHERKTDSGPARQLWRLVKEVGGPTVVVAAIFFAARIDGNIVACVKAIDKISAVVEQLGREQNGFSVELTRQATTITDLRRQVDDLTAEARRGRR